MFICKSSHYVQNYAAVGFQFERLVTGQSIDGKHDPNQVYSLQLLQIGDFRVLCAAEVDARDENGNIVEIKAGNPRFFGTKVIRKRFFFNFRICICSAFMGKSKTQKIRIRKHEDNQRPHVVLIVLLCDSG